MLIVIILITLALMAVGFVIAEKSYSIDDFGFGLATIRNNWFNN